ncbi:MAG: allantoate amidohydrolase [Candidatus Aminicenantales bacterium]
MDIRIDIDRLKSDIEALGEIGKDPKGGISRPSFSKADLEARAWLKARILDAGLEYRRDGAGNIFGRSGGEGKAVLAGSHIDTVLSGGRFDGAVGVLAALECLRRIREADIPLARPLEIVSFTDEEGNLVGDFLGSRAFMGLLDEEAVRRGRTSFGRPLAEVLKATDITIEGILSAGKPKPEVEAYVELHIEQGPVLESEEIPIGLVDSIAGKRYWWCSFSGRASHAGTTPLELRQDAFLGLADFALRSTRHVAASHYGSLVTIGRVAVHPGVFSIVPGLAEFALDFRSASPGTLLAMDGELRSLAEEVASSRGLVFSSKLMDATEPVRTPERMMGLLEEECAALGYPFLRLPSGAGHDAQILASGCDTGMIFIPCLDGISHSPEENIRWEDLAKGANLLLRTLVRLAS